MSEHGGKKAATWSITGDNVRIVLPMEWRPPSRRLAWLADAGEMEFSTPTNLDPRIIATLSKWRSSATIVAARCRVGRVGFYGYLKGLRRSLVGRRRAIQCDLTFKITGEIILGGDRTRSGRVSGRASSRKAIHSTSRTAKS